jgi:hypothetical protein
MSSSQIFIGTSLLEHNGSKAGTVSLGQVGQRGAAMPIRTGIVPSIIPGIGSTIKEKIVRIPIAIGKRLRYNKIYE